MEFFGFNDNCSEVFRTQDFKPVSPFEAQEESDQIPIIASECVTNVAGLRVVPYELRKVGR